MWLNVNLPKPSLTTWAEYIYNSKLTNNQIEGWYNKLKKYVKHAQLNIFVLIEILQKTQANTEANQIQISTGGT
jgi:hypothetical protein